MSSKEMDNKKMIEPDRIRVLNEHETENVAGGANITPRYCTHCGRKTVHYVAYNGWACSVCGSLSKR